MPPPAAGIRRVLSELFSSKKSRKSFAVVDDDDELPEPQSIAQVISGTQKVKDDVPLSSSTRSGGLEDVGGSHSPIHIPGSFGPSDGRILDDTEHAKELRRQASSASARLPDIQPTPSSIPPQPKPYKPSQDPTTDNPCKNLQFSTQETTSTQTALDLAKADLLRTTEEKRALKQHIRRQDEEIQKLESRSQDAERGRQSLRSDFEAQSAKIAELTQRNSKLEAEIEVIKTERKSLQDVVDDTKRQLTTKTTQLEDAIRNSNKLEDLLRTQRLATEASKTRLAQLEFRVSLLTTQKDDADGQAKKHRTHAEALQRQLQFTRDQCMCYESEAADLRCLLESRDSDLMCSQTQINELEATICAKDFELSQTASLAQQKDDAERQMEVYRDYAEGLRRESEVERERAEQVEKELTTYRGYAERLRKETEAERERAEQAEKELTTYRGYAERLRKETEAERERAEQAEKELTTYRGYAQRLVEQSQANLDKFLASEAESAELLSLLESTASDLADTKTQLASVQAERETWQGRMDAMAFDFADAKTQLAAVQEERETWQGRMDAMMHKVVASERRVRMLYYGAQSLDTPYAGNANANANLVKRVRNFARPDNPSAEIMEAILMLNVAILAAASDITPVLRASGSTSGTWTGNSRRAEAVLGEWVTSLLRNDRNWYRTQLLEPVIQMFLVDWCRAIIEAWYPKQQSFAELFVTGLSSCNYNFAGTIHFQAIQTSPHTSSPNFGSWAAQILDDLLDIISNPHLKPRDREHILLPSLMSLAQYAWDIRVALAEEDICGNLQLLVPPSDVRFQAESMNWVGGNGTGDLGIGIGIGKRAPEEKGDVVGCTGLGLQRGEVRRSEAGASFVSFETILAPNVVLARDLTS